MNESTKKVRATFAATQILSLLTDIEEDGLLSREDIETAVFAITYITIADRVRRGEQELLEDMKVRAEGLMSRMVTMMAEYDAPS